MLAWANIMLLLRCLFLLCLFSVLVCAQNTDGVANDAATEATTTETSSENSSNTTKIEITTAEDDTTAKLELRNITLPDGSEAVLYIVQGSPVTITIAEDTIIANYVEFDLESGLVRIVGEGSFESENESVLGRDFTIQLDDNNFDSRNVLISTDKIDVVGVSAQRVAGQFDVVTGQFSPCGRCGQRINDYGFRAERLRLYPGDRLIGFNVTILIKEAPLLFLPLFVLPLGPKDTQPKLSIAAGKLDTRATATLRWPYTVGENSYGYNEIRYYADVVPEEGDFFSEKLLGGRVQENYLGLGVEHHIIFEDATGLARFFYTPAFINYKNGKRNQAPIGKTQDAFELELRYQSLDPEHLPPYTPRLNFGLTRNDSQRQRIFNYDASIAQTVATELGDINTTLSSQGFFDADTSDEVTRPSYYGRGTPLFTPFKMTLRPAAEAFSLGPFKTSENQLEIAIYQDEVNRTNRSVAALDVVSAARILAGNTITLEALEPWAGFRLTGNNSFKGRYYSTQNYRKDEQTGKSSASEFERLIEWNSQLIVNQSFFGYGNANLEFKRETTEGETPFSFDAVNTISRTLLNSTLELRDPANWLSLRLQESYLFASSRPNERIGPQPLQTNLTLFGNLSWLSLTASNTFELQAARPSIQPEPDPGTIDAKLNLNLGNSQGAQLNVEIDHLQDLKADEVKRNNPDNQREPLVLFEDKTKTSGSITVGYNPVISATAKTGYLHFPLEPDPKKDAEGNIKARKYWDDLELSATLGTPSDADFIPSLKVTHKRDVNEGKPISLNFEFTADANLWGAILHAQAKQDYTFTEKSEKSTGSYSVTWRDVLTLEASGFSVIPADWFGLEIKEQLEQQKFEIREARSTGNARWRLTYERQFDPICRNCLEKFKDEAGFSNSKLSAFANLDAGVLGPVEYFLDANARLRLADQSFEVSYLEELKLKFYLELYETVGLQASLGYQGVYNSKEDKFSTQKLNIDNLGLSVRLSDELYLSAILKDIWDFTLEPDATTGNTPYNFQPTFHLVWDRCCWSLYSSWNSATGAIKISLGLPGTNKGLEQEIDTELRLPGRTAPTKQSR